MWKIAPPPWWQATLWGRRSTKLVLASKGLFGPAIGYNSSMRSTRLATRSVPNTSILGLQIENCRWRIFPNLILASGMCKSMCNTISWCRSRSACQHNSSNTHRGATTMHEIIFHLVEGLMGAHWSFTWRMNIYPWRLPSRLHVMRSKMDPIPSSTNLLHPLLNFGKINQINQVYPLVSFHNNHVCSFCFPRYQTPWHLGKSP